MIENLGDEIRAGVFRRRMYSSMGVKIDRFIVKPGQTIPFHGNEDGKPYKLIACTSLSFLSLAEDGRVNEYRQMEPGEELTRKKDFKHTLVNLSSNDFVILKIWPWPPEDEGGRRRRRRRKAARK